MVGIVLGGTGGRLLFDMMGLLKTIEVLRVGSIGRLRVSKSMTSGEVLPEEVTELGADTKDGLVSRVESCAGRSGTAGFVIQILLCGLVG